MKTGQDRHPRLVILLALPRSGSTLTYQALVHSLQPLYLSNLWNLLYAIPWTGGALSKRRCIAYHSDFRSSYGFVEGICGPAEGLRFWSYWGGMGLNDTEKVSSSQLLMKRASYLRCVISSLTEDSAPFVTGYLGHVLAVQRLQEWFPEAVFVRLHRDPLSNAASILRSRQSGSSDWFSVFPHECEDVRGKGVHQEVAAQVYWLNRRLDSVDENNRTIHIHYEDLCNSPSATVGHVIEKCNRLELAVEMKNSLPQSFQYRLASPGDSDGNAKLHDELMRLSREHGELAGSGL